MKKIITFSTIAGILVVAGCTAAQENKAIVAGQTFCAKATATGPLVVALANAAGAPVLVTGLSSAVVAANCAVIGAIPVATPANPAAVPVVAAPITTSSAAPIPTSVK
jgi:hypothetical protein